MAAVLLAAGSLTSPETRASEPPPAPKSGGSHAAAAPAAAPDDAKARQALKKLMDGNKRYVAGRATHPDQTRRRRVEVSKGQSPFAIVLTCSDSRVAPELLFDQGLGDIFVIRNAGNILDDHVIGSMEYAVEHLHVPLIMVVCHEKCGAVSAAVEGGEAHGHVRTIVEALAPCLEKARDLPGDKVENVVQANARHCADVLSHSEPVLREALEAHHLLVVAARYDLDSGRVEVLK